MDQQGTSSHNMFFFCVALSCGLVLELCSPKAMFWFYLILASCQGLACCQLSLSFPDLLQAFHGTQHQQGDGSNSAGSLRSSLIERKETNPEKKMYEIIDGYSLLFMAKAPRHDARVIPFNMTKCKYNSTYIIWQNIASFQNMQEKQCRAQKQGIGSQQRV